MTRGNRLPTALAALSLTCAVLLPAGLLGQVPTPASVIGFEPGTDYMLADYGQIQRYFLALDEASDRVVLEQIGESTLGKPMYLALISSEENLRNRDRYREMSEQLARAEGLSDQEARRFAGDGKAVVWIDGGLHATEVAGGQMTPLLAYWAATDEGEEARRIRENVIFLLMPNMNPDGLDIVVDWYRKNVGTPFETAPVPELYHSYIGHDNNRDWYMFTQVETQVVANQLYHLWFPQIVYNHHQRGPFP
ncbi:MAG: M14 family zinc carboxypeptidase, partial [Gemmatimonadota bacterium]